MGEIEVRKRLYDISDSINAINGFLGRCPRRNALLSEAD